MSEATQIFFSLGKTKFANIFMAGGAATLFFSLDKTKSANTLMVGGAARYSLV